MEQAVQQRVATETRTLAKKSWTAYLSIALLGLVGLRIGAALFHSSALAGILVLIVVAVFAAYRIIEIRSVELYYDDSGVWLRSGVLPWNKGTRGVKWRDIENAVFYQSMASWIFKSYKLRIAHRFTRTSEILLSSMGRGNEAVEKINMLHQHLIRNGSVN